MSSRDAALRSQQNRLNELQVLLGVMPYLKSDAEEAQKRQAIHFVKTLAGTRLAAEIATLDPSEGKVQALNDIAQASTEPVDRKIASDAQSLATLLMRAKKKYAEVTLATSLQVSEHERELVTVLIQAARAVDEIFWMQAYGDKRKLMDSISDPSLRNYAEINYGPWDRTEQNQPFIANVGPKPAGAAFYPEDMSKVEFETALKTATVDAAGLISPYTLIRRDEKGKLFPVPYSRAFAEPLRRAAMKLRTAAALAEEPGLRRYLSMRSAALLSDDYRPSDVAWMEMKSNRVDVVIGPIETYEDGLFGYKTSYEAYVLIKDEQWSRRLARYISLLPRIQESLPVPLTYKRETPSATSDLNAYDVVFCGGDCNAGAKSGAIILPNDDQVQLKMGTRRLQLKNATHAKFEKLLVPVVERLVASDQRRRVTFDAYFTNTMLHEVSHWLGLRNTINKKGSVREALKEHAWRIEECKADLLSLHMVSQLAKLKESSRGDLRDNYVTYMAHILQSFRSGGITLYHQEKAVQFNFLQQAGAITRDDATGTYRMNFEKTGPALEALSEKILEFQGDGDYDGVAAYMDLMGQVPWILETDLQRLDSLDLPFNFVYKQGETIWEAQSRISGSERKAISEPN